MLNKTTQNFFTGDLSTLVNHFIKQHVFHVLSGTMIFAIPITQKVQLRLTSIFLCKGCCYGDTTVSWSPMLIFDLEAKKICSYNSIYPLKKFVIQKNFF